MSLLCLRTSTSPPPPLSPFLHGCLMLSAKRMKGKRGSPRYRLFFQGGSDLKQLREGSVLEIPGGSRNSQFYDANFFHVGSTSRSTYIFNIRVTRVLPLSGGELGTISKNSFRKITLATRPIWGFNCLALHSYLVST